MADVFQSANSFVRNNRLFDYVNNFRFHIMDVSFKIPTVLTLSAGFKAVTAPDLTIDVKEVKHGTFEYKKAVPMGATVSPITLQQGVKIFNSDFYNWISDTVEGKTGQRRNLLLVQFSDAGLIEFGQDITIPFIPINDLFSRVPARAWMLKDCIPIHYKSGTDFDALGDDISISELQIQPWYFTELNLGV